MKNRTRLYTQATSHDSRMMTNHSPTTWNSEFPSSPADRSAWFCESTD